MFKFSKLLGYLHLLMMNALNIASYKIVAKVLIVCDGPMAIGPTRVDSNYIYHAH